MTLPATLDALEARAKADAESGWMDGAEQLALVRALKVAVDYVRSDYETTSSSPESAWAQFQARILAILAGVRGA